MTESGLYLRNGDHVCFFGDSITEQRLFTSYVEAFILTRFPGMRVTFTNRGWGGDTSWGEEEGGTAETRAARDVKPLDPTVVTVMIGMNDGGYVPYNAETENQFKTEYPKMHVHLKAAAPQARFTLIRTSPWDDYTRPANGYNDALKRYGKVVEDTARQSGDLYVDFNEPMVKVMEAGKDDDLEMANWIVPDSIHPGVSGHLIMAGELLMAWGAPSLISSVVVDASSGRVIQAEQANLSELRADGKRICWTQEDEALPFCVAPDDKAVQLVLRHYDFQERLNRQMFRVEGLEAGLYLLEIDGQAVGTFKADELGAGINLANYNTPMRRQSVEVLDLVQKKSALQFMRWKEIEVRFGHSVHAEKASRGLGLLEREVAEELGLRVRTEPHDFAIVKVNA